MKSKWMVLPVIMLAVFGLLMMGCPNDTKTTPDNRADWTVAADAGDTTPSITITFNKAVEGLDKDDIQIENVSGEAIRDSLTPDANDPKVYVLAISNVKRGIVNVKIEKSGIKTGSKPVTLTKPYAYYLNSAKLQVPIADLPGDMEIEDGREYTISFNITALDASLVGGHFGGQLYAANDDETENEGKPYLLAGWQNGDPQTIVATTTTYKWTFETGEKYVDGSPATTVAAIEAALGATYDGEFYFELTANQADWSTPYTGKLGFDGTVTIERKPLMVNSGVTIGTTFPGNLESADLTKLQAAAEGSELYVNVTATVIEAGKFGPGWGIGKFGDLEFSIPSTVENGSNVSFVAKVSVADVLAQFEGKAQIYVNIWGDNNNGTGSECTINTIEIWSPQD